MVFDYIMSVGRTPQLTQDVNINPYSAYNDDLCQGGTISYSLTTGGTGTITGDIQNCINPNYSDVFPIYSYSLNDVATSQILIDLKRVVGVGKQYIDLRTSRTDGSNPIITITIDGSKDNVLYETIYTSSVTAGSGTITLNVTNSTFGVYKFLRYYRITAALSGGASADTSVLQIGSIRLFPDYIQY